MSTIQPTADLRVVDLPRPVWAWLATLMIAVTLVVTTLITNDPAHPTSTTRQTTDQTVSPAQTRFLGEFVFGLPTVVAPLAPADDSGISMGGGGTPLYYN